MHGTVSPSHNRFSETREASARRFASSASRPSRVTSASASALVAPQARGAAALSSRLAPLEVQKGSIVRVMRPESCAAASDDECESDEG